MKKTYSTVKAYARLSEEDKLRIVAQRVIDAQVDTTGNRRQWLNICFGFTLVLGEAGRTLFHDISRFYPYYSHQECDALYDDCMKRLQTERTDGITIASFYGYVKKAGISTSPLTDAECAHTAPYLAPNAPVGEMGEKGENAVPSIETMVVALNLFSPKVANKLPRIFQDIASLGITAQQKDMLLFAAIALLSGCFPEVWANYDGRLVFSNLYFFLVAPPASNKGIVTACLKLVALIEQEIRDRNEQEMEEYRQKMAELKASKNKVGFVTEKEPPYRSLLVSANSSTTAVYQALSDNDGVGITFESEADALANSLKSDHGDFSEGLRKGFHHECISYTRRTDKEHVRINFPKWSVFLTGTPGQVTNLIPSCEDGLFSRICFMLIQREGTWRNVFAKRTSVTIDAAMSAIGERVYEIHRLLSKAGKEGIEFRLTEAQEGKFNDFFSQLYKEFGSMMGENFDANILRMGLSCFRIMMVLSINRLEDATTLPQYIECTDDDFDAAIIIANTLIEHSALIFSNLMPSKETEPVAKAKLTELQHKLFKALPDHYTTQQALAMAQKLDMVPKTINKYLGLFVTRFGISKRVRQGEYEKVKSTDSQ